MHVMRSAFTAAVILCLALASQPSNAAQVSAAASVSARAPIGSAGSRIDNSHPLPASRPRPPSDLPYRVLDQAIYAHAKADAAKRAGQSGGPGSYARSDFSLSVAPSNQTVVQGSSTTYTVSTQATAGSARPVSLSATGLPSGASASFNPSSVPAGQSSTLTVATTTTAATGAFAFTITGQYSSPPATHSIPASLTVTAAPPDDFSVSASPSSQTVTQGSSATYSVATQVTSGTAQAVSFSITGLPSGATGTFAPASVLAGGSSTLTVSTTTTTPTGTSALMITGASSAATHTTGVSLVIATASTPGPTIGVTWNGQSEA